MNEFTKLTLEELAQHSGQPGSQKAHWVAMEFQRRQTIAILETAEYTKRNARYMLYSVIVLAAASIASFVLGLLTFFS